MATQPNETFTSSFSVQAISGSIYGFIRLPGNSFVNMKNFGGSVGQGMVQTGFTIDPAIIPAFTSALSGALAAGTGSFSFG